MFNISPRLKLFFRHLLLSLIQRSIENISNVKFEGYREKVVKKRPDSYLLGPHGPNGPSPFARHTRCHRCTGPARNRQSDAIWPPEWGTRAGSPSWSPSAPSDSTAPQNGHWRWSRCCAARECCTRWAGWSAEESPRLGTRKYAEADTVSSPKHAQWSQFHRRWAFRGRSADHLDLGRAAPWLCPHGPARNDRPATLSKKPTKTKKLDQSINQSMEDLLQISKWNKTGSINQSINGRSCSGLRMKQNWINQSINLWKILFRSKNGTKLDQSINQSIDLWKILFRSKNETKLEGFLNFLMKSQLEDRSRMFFKKNARTGWSWSWKNRRGNMTKLPSDVRSVVLEDFFLEFLNQIQSGSFVEEDNASIRRCGFSALYLALFFRWTIARKVSATPAAW